MSEKRDGKKFREADSKRQLGRNEMNPTAGDRVGVHKSHPIGSKKMDDYCRVQGIGLYAST